MLSVYYDDQLIQKMLLLYNSLSEKDRRRYAGIEAMKLEHGGTSYLASIFFCDEKTIKKGMDELSDDKKMQQNTVRFHGGGRLSKLQKIKNIDSVFLQILKDYTAGDPMRKDVKWTNLTKAQIKNSMSGKGIEVSRNIIKKLLKKHGFSKRKAQKKQSIGEHKDRDKQFNHIKNIRKKYEKSDNPIISVDSKKKEYIGNLYRDGKLECTKSIKVYDHDYPHLSEGKITPYGIYDIKANNGFINIGTSNDTSEFACDSIKLWWYIIGKKIYHAPTEMLILSDAGGSNSYRSHVYKEDLQNLSNDIGVKLRIAHYPSYASKWNPIEHRLFCHVTHAMSGVILKSVELVKEVIEMTATRTGLKVLARISKKIYEKGRKITDDFYENSKIARVNILGDWNYVVSPM